DARDRAVAGLTARMQTEAEDALFADREGEVAAAIEVDHLATTLVDDHVATNRFGMLLAEPAGTLVGPGLLVGGDHEHETATGRPPTFAGESQAGRCFAGDLVLHVERAPAPDVAVHDLATPGVSRPLG